VYAKFSPAEKAKHWQHRHPGQERGTGPTGGRKSGVSATNVSDFATAISSAVSAISALTDTTKRANEERTDDEPTNPTAIILPWLARPKRPSPIDPLPLVFLPLELFAWQSTLDVILLILILK